MPCCGRGPGPAHEHAQRGKGPGSRPRHPRGVLLRVGTPPLTRAAASIKAALQLQRRAAARNSCAPPATMYRNADLLLWEDARTSS
jgi:hypothetical protein